MAVRPRPDARPLSARVARARAHAAPGPPVSARFRSLRRLARDLRAVSRNRPSPASASPLPSPTEHRQVPLRRRRSLRVAPGLALEWHATVVRPHRARGDAASLHRPAAARVRALGQASGALLPICGDDDHALVRGRADFPALPGGAPVGRGGAGPTTWADPDSAQPRARSLGRARLPLDLRLEADRP